MATYLKSLFGLTCPRCRKGHLFAKPFSLKTIFSMPERCEVCDQDYFPEPGFYFGAMFIGYVFTAFLFLFFAGILIYGLGLSVDSGLIWVTFIAVLLYPYLFRFSRSLWIHFMVKYDPKAAEKN